VVSGDYCDYIATGDGDLWFMVGDVAGKGIAASMLMAHLRATLRTLVHMHLPLAHVMRRASSLFRESAPPAQYATLVLGRASLDGTGHVYGDERLTALAARSQALELPALVRALLTDVVSFQAGIKRQDDITVAAIRRLE
jgi:serine phosphatase RsbU (regulator of sigma subunit)